MSQIIDIPSDILKLILYNLKGEDIIQFCQTNTQIAKLCSDDKFWLHKFLKEFGPPIIRKPQNMRWKHFYYLITHDIIRPSLVKLEILQKRSNEVDYEIVDNIWVDRNTTLEHLLSFSKNKHKFTNLKNTFNDQYITQTFNIHKPYKDNRDKQPLQIRFYRD